MIGEQYVGRGDNSHYINGNCCIREGERRILGKKWPFSQVGGKWCILKEPPTAAVVCYLSPVYN